MKPQFRATLGAAGRKKAMVVSHERSGTHFLMNTLAANFGYVSAPWFNFDFDTGLNFHSPENLAAFFRQLKGRPVLNIFKSHHEAGFLLPLLPTLLAEFSIFYIYRDPRDVMVSFWRLVCSLPWDEGPKTETAADFVTAPPRGAMLRYQKRQAPSILHRWKRHVAGWTFDLPAAVTDRIHYVRYEDLNLDFDRTVRRLSKRIDIPAPDRPVRPNRSQNVILPGEGKVGGHCGRLEPRVLRWIERHAETLMERLGYRSGRDPARAAEQSDCSRPAGKVN